MALYEYENSILENRPIFKQVDKILERTKNEKTFEKCIEIFEKIKEDIPEDIRDSVKGALIVKLVDKFKTIKELDYTDAECPLWKLQDVFIPEHCRELETIIVDVKHNHDNFIINLFKIAPNLKNYVTGGYVQLPTLQTKKDSIKFTTIKELSEKCPRLEYLILGGVNMSDSWLRQIAQNCNNLKYIKFIIGDDLTASGMRLLFSLLHLVTFEITYSSWLPFWYNQSHNNNIKKEFSDVERDFEINKILNKKKLAFLAFCSGNRVSKAPIYTHFFNSSMYDENLLKYIFSFI